VYHTADRWITTEVSRDGGASWQRGSIAVGAAAPSGSLMATWDTLGDQAVAFASDGTVLVSGLAFNYTSVGVAYQRSGAAIVVARSSDGGLSFPDASLVAPGAGLEVGQGQDTAFMGGYLNNDKEWLATGPGGLVLVSWFGGHYGPVRALGAVPVGSTGWDFMARVSRDGGRSWEAPVTVVADTAWGFTHPALLPDGRMAIALASGALSVWTSDDGRAWKEHPVGTSMTQPILKGDGDRLLLAYADSGSDDLAPGLRASFDGGATWGAFVPVGPSSADGRVAMDVDAQHRIVVAWYRDDKGTLAYVARGWLPGGRFTPVLQLADGIASPARQYGDYMALAMAGPDGATIGWFSADGDARAFWAARLSWVSSTTTSL
jgi:hypothetical protein